MSDFIFPRNILRMNRPNFTKICMHIYMDKIKGGIVTCHSLGKFITELWPLIDASISFFLNILRKNWQNLTKFVYTLILTRSRLGLLCITIYVIIPKFVSELRSLIDVRILGWDCCTLLLSNRVMSWIYLCPVIELWRGYIQILWQFYF